MIAPRHLAAILGAWSLLCTSAASAQTPGAIVARCEELHSESFPPNLLLRSEDSAGRVVSVLQSSKVGAWGAFFLRVDQPGTYRVDVGLRKGPDEAVFQLVVDGDPVGPPVDGYAAGSAAPVEVPVGDVTFQKPGIHSFRFLVTGKNPASSGFALALEKLTATPGAGFTLLSPNGSCEEGTSVLLRWHAWPDTRQYQVEVDGRAAGTVDAPATSYRFDQPSRGSHRWRVVAIDLAGKQKPSNIFSFVAGPPPAYPCREFTETFATGHPGEWSLDAMNLAGGGPGGALRATGTGSAVLRDVRLDKTEGEIATHFTPGSAEAAVGVGFRSDDGTRVYAVADLSRQQLRIERSIEGPARYSIFEVTPKSYCVPGWAERETGDRTTWEIAAKPITVHPGIACELKLAYSRRSGCVMATLVPADGSPAVTLRDLTDLRTPDHPLLLTLAGAASFADVSLRLLNRSVYKWDPDTTRVVLRPGPPGSWDEKGAFNPAIVVRDGVWHMVYRGNSKPAPPNGPISSELGLATSTDGIHWTKSPANPIFPKEAASDSLEDPDLIWPQGSDQVYLEYHSFHVGAALPDSAGKPGRWPHGEVMRSSPDFVHWSDPWVLNIGKTFGKNGGFVDTQDAGIAAVERDGAPYRYLTMIEEGRIDLSNDLHQWIKAGTADLKGSPERWCTSHECSGDIFVDADKNIRFESQIGVNPEPGGHGGAVVGNRLCTIGEGVLSGSDPTKVLWRSDLPWLTDWYGDAPTGASEDFTATNGSVFPGQTIIKDGWLRHYSGGNNHFVILTECRYGPVIECRDLRVVMDAAGQCSVSVTARNVGSLNGSGQVTLSIDGKPEASQQVTLNRDTEMTLHWTVSVPVGMHTLTVDDLSATLTVEPGSRAALRSDSLPRRVGWQPAVFIKRARRFDLPLDDRRHRGAHPAGLQSRGQLDHGAEKRSAVLAGLENSRGFQDGDERLFALAEAYAVRQRGIDLANPLETRPESGSPASSGEAAAPAANPPQDLVDLDPEQHDTIWTQACAAIDAGDVGTIDGFLRRGLDVNADLENSSSLLFVAVDANQLPIVKLLLAHGANVLQKTSWGDVPLQRACWRGYKEVADALIAAGAPNNELWYATGTGDVPALEARDRRQPITPEEARGKLFFAVASGHPNTFDFLWQKLGPLDDTKKGKLLGDLYENAGKWGHPNMLPVLEALGASPAKDGPRALLLAAIWNFPDTVKALLERGVPPEPPSQHDLLRDIAGEGHLEVVRLLLDHGANINVQDAHGFTSLSWAAYCGYEDMCLLLLERGADARIEDRDGHNAAWHAAAGPHCAEALARMIAAGVPVDKKDKRGATILEHMTNSGTPQAWKGSFFMKVYSPADIARFDESERRVVELLLAAGLDPNGPEGGPAPLTEAMHSEHWVMAQALLDRGADATLRNKDGVTALYELLGYARDEEFPLELFRTLAARTGDLNRVITVPGTKPPMQTTFLETLLNLAARQGRGIAAEREAIGILLSAGAVFPGVSDEKVQTLLQAAARGDLARMQESVRRGVGVSAADEEGWDALSIATALGHIICADWLIDQGADVNGQHHWPWNRPLNFAVRSGQADLVEKLLAKGAKIDGAYGGLYSAVDQKNARIFAALLKAGADPTEKSNATMSTGGKTFTPRSSLMLYVCIEKGLTDMARTLLDKGADAEPANLENNRNLAYWAVDYDRPEILQSLLDHGADPLAKDDKGKTALDLARKSHPKLVPLLEKAATRKSSPPP